MWLYVEKSELVGEELSAGSMLGGEKEKKKKKREHDHSVMIQIDLWKPNV